MAEAKFEFELEPKWIGSVEATQYICHDRSTIEIMFGLLL